MSTSHFRDSLADYWFVDIAYEQIEAASLEEDRAHLRDNPTLPMPYVREHRPGEFGPLVAELLAWTSAEKQQHSPWGDVPVETKIFVEVWLYKDGTMVRRPAVYSRPVLRGGESE